MEPKWTDKQLQAITTRNKTILVSAAAGSGKTATLTERIVSKLTGKTYTENENNENNNVKLSNIDKMLVVTFTRPSAADLKRKISDAISKELAKDPANEHLSKQLILLESANISTIDSFYLNIVKSNFQRLGIPSNFRLGDDTEMDLLRKEIMEDIIERHYDLSEDSVNPFIPFVENFVSAKNSEKLSEIFLALENKLYSTIDGLDTIMRFANELENDAKCDFFQSRQGKIIYEYVKSGVNYYHSALEKCCDIIEADENASVAYLPALLHDRDFFAEYKEVLKEQNYASAREKSFSLGKKNLKSLDKKFLTPEISACKSLKAEGRKFIDTINKKYYPYDENEVKDMMLKTREILISLYTILTEFSEAALNEKIKRKVFGFNDIRRFAYKLLTNEDGSPSDIAITYREQFEEIYIDEYQDVDAMQDKMFSLISNGNNRFMVGDIKQSIYSFRNADSNVFAGYKKSFPDFEKSQNSDSALIFMSNNFRCDKNVIDFTNKVFEFLFGYCGENIEYTPDDKLILSKKEEGRTLPSPDVIIKVITSDKTAKDDGDDEGEDDADENDEMLEINSEALWIASEINRLINNEYKADGSKIEPRDIAVIMSTSTHAKDVAKALALYNIPCSDNSKYDLFSTPDVLLAISLLSTIDNPHKDIPLAATLYSPIFGYTMDELIEIRNSADSKASLFEALRDYNGENESIKEKNAYFIDKLTSYREFASSVSIDKLLNHLYRDLSMTSLLGVNQQNLTRLYEMARRFEAGSFKGLNNFISHINDLMINKKHPKITNEDAEGNTVKMVTAHKSKGLEFPVCFIYNIQSRFNTDDIKPNLLYHARAGIALKFALEGGMAQLNNPIREAVALEMKNAQTEEEMRLLYVAMTRARERLYISAHTGSHIDKLEEKAFINSKFADKFRILKSINWLDMILASIYPLESGSCYVFDSIERDEIEINIGESDFENSPKTSAVSFTQEEVATLKERLEFEYPYEHLNKLPAKLSVSKLSPTVLDDIDNDAATLESFDEAKILEIEEFFNNKSKISSADRGTATHLFLQFCDFDNAKKNGVKEELTRLVENKFIAPQVAELINLKQIENFFKSDFFAVLENAKIMYREQRFNILLPASHFTQDEEFKSSVDEEDILVQGVIDIFFEDENGNIILCDYKTDHLLPEELKDETLVIKKMKERHGKQLEYYAMAIERFLGKAPDKILIYSLPFGEAIEIK